MALQRQQENDVFQAIQEVGLNPADFEWGDQHGDGGLAQLVFRPLEEAVFRFFYTNAWWIDYMPGHGVPRNSQWVDTWSEAYFEVIRWLRVVRSEVDAPDLWGALLSERELLAEPGDTTSRPNSPFTPAELESVVKELESLKTYVRAAFELSGSQQQEVEAKLDYLAESAARAPGRIDWWNQAVGAIINLALTSAVQPQVAQGLLSMAAHGLGHLFGTSPGQLMP